MKTSTMCVLISIFVLGIFKQLISVLENKNTNFCQSSKFVFFKILIQWTIKN